MAKRVKHAMVDLSAGKLKKPLNPSIWGTAEQADREEKGGRRGHGRKEGAGARRHGGRGGKVR